MGVGQNTVGATDVVIDHFGFLFQEIGARVFLVFDDLGEDLFEALDDGSFGFAQGHLV